MNTHELLFNIEYTHICYNLPEKTKKDKLRTSLHSSEFLITFYFKTDFI